MARRYRFHRTPGERQEMRTRRRRSQLKRLFRYLEGSQGLKGNDRDRKRFVEAMLRIGEERGYYR